MLFFLATLLSGCGAVPGPASPDEKADEPFSGERAYAHVRYLAGTVGSRPAASEKAREAADYIAKELRASKTGVDRPSFEFKTYVEKSVELEVVQPPEGSLKARSLQFSAAGKSTAELIDGKNGGREDLTGLDAKGKIVLIRRGTIPFADKVQNAADGGAAGVVIYNNAEGELRGSLGKLSKIPAVGVTQSAGKRLLSFLEAGPVTARLLVDAETATEHSENVVGTRTADQSDKIVILGGHYDSVEAGPGANDNASGVGTVLELARVTAGRTYPFELRFIAFGAEEVGLIGSQRYVESLNKEERQRVLAVLNFDMVGVGDDLKFGGTARLVSEAKESSDKKRIAGR